MAGEGADGNEVGVAGNVAGVRESAMSASKKDLVSAAEKSENRKRNKLAKGREREGGA